jgi:hypothetical protein
MPRVANAIEICELVSALVLAALAIGDAVETAFQKTYSTSKARLRQMWQ